MLKNGAKNKAYLTLLIAENQRIITNFATQAKKNIEISGCAKREHRDFQRAKLLIIITYTQVSQRPGGSLKIKQLDKSLTAFFFVKYRGFTLRNGEHPLMGSAAKAC